MQATRYCAFNKTREIFLSLDTPVLDAAFEPLKVLRVLVEGPGAAHQASLWLTHFKAVPVARALSPFDLIYLDRNYHVVHAVALAVDGNFEPFAGEPACALVLPSGTIAASATQAGDQFVITAQPEAQAKSPPAPPPAPANQLAPAETPPAQPFSVPPALRPYLRSAASPASFPALIPEVSLPLAPPPELQPAVTLSPAAAPPAVAYAPEPEPTPRMRLLRWLFPASARPDPAPSTQDRRRADRLSQPNLVAYFFTGGAPRPCHVESISVTGFYMKSDHLWMPGTIIRMTLQLIGTTGDDPGDTVTVHSRVVRHDADGGAFEFVLSGFLD